MPAKPPAGKTLYYPVIVAPGRKSGYAWGKPCDSPKAANLELREMMARDNAPLGFLVRFGDGGPDVMISYTLPLSASRIIEKYDRLLEALEREHPEAFE